MATFPGGVFTKTDILNNATSDVTDVNDLSHEITAIETALVGGTLPAANGSALTALNGSNIASGTVASARIATTIARWDGTGTPGGQIAFPAVQVPSADPNTLDDYEEGTWTPSLTNGSLGNGSIAGVYVKIGKWVWFTITLTFGSTTSFSGAVGMSLPATAAASGNTPVASGWALDFGVSSYPIEADLATTTRMDLTCHVGNVAFVTRGFVNATQPFTWGTSDELRLRGAYAASA